ncbi:FERM domain-containing protein [Aphelenchoides bicaudatus]|nr:FERM domain-containing protein [Aphelenchoides bicaudatus]
MQHRYQKNNRKLSVSRGIKLPTIKLEDVSRPKSINLAELSRERSPPIAHSPVGYILRHDSLLATDLNRSTHSESFNATGEDNVVDIRIFFANGKAVQLSVENGAEATVSDLLPLMAEYLNIEEEIVNEALSLWLISPLFELQLSSHHIAHELHTKWPLFLRRFTVATQEEIDDDEPLLVIKRNVHLPIPVEIMYQDQYERLTEVLYFDAKDEYMTGRYIVDIPTCIKVSALQLAIEDGPLEKNEDAFEVVHDRLAEIVPAYLLNRVKSFYLFGKIECKSGLEKQIIRQYNEVSCQYTNNYERRKAYLDLLRQLPMYGSSFFNATTDRRQSGSLVEMSKRIFSSGQQQVELLVGINCEYFTLMDKQKNELLLTRFISDCSWFSGDQAKDHDEDIPSFFIHFPDDTALTEDGSSPSTPSNEQIPQPVLVSRLLQIFSKQAVLMQNLMDMFYDKSECELGSTEELHPASSPESEIHSPLHNQLATNNSTVSKSSKSTTKSDVPSPTPSIQSSKLSKLCMATLDENGRCVEAQGTLKRILECY